jgi:polar amino acid transport system substrate-binding protein
LAATPEPVVTVGLDASPPPPLHTGHPGEGFEVDLLKAIAERAGFQIRYQSALWSELTQRLADHKLDMICTAATITEERRQIVDFSEPYLEYELALVVGRDRTDIQGVADLAGKSVGVRVATTAEQFARRCFTASRLQFYHFNTEAYSALAEGTLDAVVDDFPIAKGFENLLPKVRVAFTIEGTKSHYGIMFARGSDELRRVVDQALRALRQDGTYDALYRKWFN